MKELVEVINHLSLLPSLKLDNDLYRQILERKVKKLYNDYGPDNQILVNLEKILFILPKLKTLPKELSYLLFDIQTICLDIVDHLENRGLETDLAKKVEKSKLILEKIDRVLCTYIAEDPKRYFRYSIIIKDIYNRLNNIFEMIREKQKFEGNL